MCLGKLVRKKAKPKPVENVQSARKIDQQLYFHKYGIFYLLIFESLSVNALNVI